MKLKEFDNISLTAVVVPTVLSILALIGQLGINLGMHCLAVGNGSGS